MSLLNYLSWYISLNSSSFFESTVQSLHYKSLLSLHNKNGDFKILNYFYIDKIDNEIVTRSSQDLPSSPEETCLFIGPNITLDNINILIPKCNTIFYLTNKKIRKEVILERWYLKLALYASEENYFLLDEEISEEILIMIFNRSKIVMEYNKKEVVSYVNGFGIYTCLLVIFICMTSILFIICGAYSTVNPIVTEIELERFKVIKFKDIKEQKEDSCLICFEVYDDDEELRILFCNHYFHKTCVDKWLCEQSSRCPYCRYSNKNYEEV
ncbi:E3 ubiquitin-protein ligase RNF13 [Vairimorpha necatrix]|uniref:RING-type E3 ubiquitin transferase n=1 Tax=Vairimorpha necatrix TaxID=6039 RepID=A0AAX4JAX0_9MICR